LAQGPPSSTGDVRRGRCRCFRMGKLVETDAAAAQKRKPRELKQQITDVEVKQAIKDNLKDFTAAELHTNTNADGQTCVQVLADRKRKNREDKRRYPCGGPFYEDLRSTFKDQESPSKRLKAVDKSQPIRDSLLKPMLALANNNSNRGPMNAAIAALDDVNQHELTGILQYFLRLKPTASVEQFRYCITVLEFLARCGIPEKFPADGAIVKAFVDKVLLSAWNRMDMKKPNREKIFQTYEALWKLVLPEAAVRAIRAHEGQWVEIADKVTLVHDAGELGKAMFGEITSCVLAEKADVKISQDIEALLAQEGQVTMAKINKARKETVAALATMGLGSLPERRKITLKYRECSYDGKVTCIGDEVEQRYWTRIRAQCAAQRLIPGLFCEDQLVDTAVGKEVDFHPGVYSKAKSARESANEGMAEQENTDGKAVAAYLERSEKSLIALDTMWKSTDHQWMLSMVGKAGEQRLLDKSLAIIPGKGEKKKKLTEVAKEMCLLLSSDLAKFCSDTARGNLQSVIDSVSLMVSGKPLNFQNKGNEFVNRFLAKAAGLVSSGTGANAKYGKEAVVALLAGLQEKPQPVALEELDDVVVYQWLLDKPQRDKVKQLEALAVAAVGGAPKASSAAGPSAGSASPSAAAPKKAARKGKSELEKAMAMFGGGL